MIINLESVSIYISRYINRDSQKSQKWHKKHPLQRIQSN